MKKIFAAIAAFTVVLPVVAFGTDLPSKAVGQGAGMPAQSQPAKQAVSKPGGTTTIAPAATGGAGVQGGAAPRAESRGAEKSPASR